MAVFEISGTADSQVHGLYSESALLKEKGKWEEQPLGVKKAVGARNHIGSRGKH